MTVKSYMTNQDSGVVNILWTGGYDSTFRICQLAQKNVVIQPIYISDNRLSESYELNAIKTIEERLLLTIIVF